MENRTSTVLVISTSIQEGALRKVPYAKRDSGLHTGAGRWGCLGIRTPAYYDHDQKARRLLRRFAIPG
jgi:hypothetical protein